MQRLITATVEHHGRIDCLVNNAGWREYTHTRTRSVSARDHVVLCHTSMFGPDPPHKSIDETTAAEFRELLNLNLLSYFLTSKVSS